MKTLNYINVLKVTLKYTKSLNKNNQILGKREKEILKPHHNGYR